MKKFIYTTAAIIIGLTAFALDGSFTRKWYTEGIPPGPGSSNTLRFEVHGRYSRPVNKEMLTHVRQIGDFVPGYPVNWISDYISVDIMAICNGKTMKASSPNDLLNDEQKNILRTADLASELVINVRHKYKNPVTEEREDRKVNISMTVVPEVEAEFLGGSKEMRKYLKERLIDRASEWPEQFQHGAVIFTVNEDGNIFNVKISKSSGDANTDKLLLEGIQSMPKWKPAEYSNGTKVKQDFVFSFGNDGC